MKQNLKTIVPYIFGGFLLFVILNLKRIKLFFEKKKAVVNTLTANEQKVEISGSDVTLNLDTIASSIYYSFYQSDGSKRWNEDETNAVEQVIKVPKDTIQRLSAVYATKFGKILKDDLISKLRTSQWQKIEFLFN